ncbi:MAG: OmpA family protein [Microscillaceae bacterium]|nr:OmpA family protein [Microscillaceae bacterium]
MYYSRRKDDGTWTEGRNLGLMVNSMSWDSHPALSHSGDTLFFSSDRLGGFGGADIYYTHRVGFQLNIKGQEIDTVWIWERAQNIGPVINTRYNELSPFYHPTFNVLYFSSDGHLVNFGGFDIYRTYRRGPVWTTPRNIGPLVNYKTDEYYFTIDSRALNLYYAKGVRTKVYDPVKRDSVWKEILNLHTAALPMEAQPEARVRFEVMVTDSITGEISKGFVSIIDLDDGIEVAPRYIREDGSARFDLIRDKNYLIIISGDDFLRIEREFLLKGDTTLAVNAPSIKFRKWKFESIEFEEASAEVTNEMKPDLEKLVLFLADHPQLGLKISGHTDSRGNASDNMLLSQARADAIRNYILQRGRFKPARVEAKGFGNTQPIVPDEKTDEDRFKNRRVEFEILRMVP